MTPSRVRIRLLPLVCTLLLAACGGDPDGGGGGTGPVVITSVSVTPGTASLTSLGATTQLTASAGGSAGGAVTTTFTWISSATAVATVGATGLVTAVSNGSATITAAPSGSTVSGSATVTVAQAAAAITLTIAADTLITGTTAQAAANVSDSGGAALTSPVLTWSSSNDAIATVDGTGLVTGVSDGEATITASKDGVSGIAALVVIRPDLMVAADTVLGGNVIVDELTIAAGITVTLAADLEINAKTAVTIAGTVMGDCLGVKIEGNGAVTVSGTINNACATQVQGGENAPAIEIDAPAGVDLTGATIVSSGPVTVVSEPSSGFLAAVAASAASSGRFLALRADPGTLTLDGTTIRPEPAQAPQPTDPNQIPNGANLAFRATNDMLIDGVSIRAQNGGDGVPQNMTSADPLTVSGGGGGIGGNITVRMGDTGVIRFRTTKGNSEFIGGDGGPAGPATATTTQNPGVDPAPKATAIGGAGGHGGGVTIFGPANIVGTISQVSWQVGQGARGGNATATAADGIDADGSRAAQVGGSARALAGSGGNAGTTDGGFVGMPSADSKDGGGGGIGRATAGKGGNGIRDNLPGAAGGDAEALGGAGGGGWFRAGNIGGDAIAAGGNGGMGGPLCPAFANFSLNGTISLNSDPGASDPFIFNAGSGIPLGVVYRILNALGGTGGAGGGGGVLAAVGGRGGQRLDDGANTRGPDGFPSVGAGGSGGDGGQGTPGGPGGSAGSTGSGDPSAGRFNPVFQNGASGGVCASLASPPLLAAANAADQTIEINGSGAWVAVTGILADDGTVTGTGRGTVAGTPNILVEFAGTWDASTSTLVGTYTIDSEKVISSGHPVIYNVNVSGG